VIEIAVTAAGALACLAALQVLRPVFASGPPHVRPNYRRRKVWATGGVVLLAPLAVATVAGITLHGSTGRRTAIVVGSACSAMALLGFLDDVYGDRRAGGLFGHARALFRGEFTTGMAKAGGGAVIGLVASFSLGHRGVWIVAGGAVVALAANLANLLDLRPGRTIKLWYPCAIALVASDTAQARTLALLGLTGGVSVFLVDELRERVMLGDTGAGLLGTVLGVAAVQALDGWRMLVCLGVLAVLTLASEFVSFTDVINNVRPLRWLDLLGRDPARAQKKKSSGQGDAPAGPVLIDP
jgi:UDP-GlcNAc:undecaprenyl-phosphate GlcNAc-1-phosphate transferase